MKTDLKSWHKDNPGKHAEYSQTYRTKFPDRSKNATLKYRYGISLEDLQHMKDSQNNRCKICGKTEALVVDHDHKTKQVRGLLCRLCNQGLGSFYDNTDIIASAKVYLEQQQDWSREDD